MEVKKGYKKTEVGIIPGEWECVELGSVSKYEGGSQPPLSTFSNVQKPDFIRLIQIRDYKTDKYATYIPKALARRFCKKDEIMIGRYGPPIFQILRGIEGAYNVALIKAIPFANIMKEFLYYTLKREDLFRYIELLSQRSSGQTGIDLFGLKSFLIALPPYLEQQAIADALSDVDNLINSLTKLINKKNRIKQGAMQELLTGKKRLDGFSNEWKVRKVGELVSFSNGKAHENSISNNGRYIVVNSKYISTEGKIIKYSDESYCLASKDDILMVMSDVPNGRAIAKCYYVEKENMYTVNQRVCLMTPNGVNSRFLYNKINRNPYYLSFDDGVKQTNLKKDDVLNCELLIPESIEEQIAIANILSDMDAEIEALEQKLNKYKSIKQGMMQELLTGRIRLI